ASNARMCRGLSPSADREFSQGVLYRIEQLRSPEWLFQNDARHFIERSVRKANVGYQELNIFACQRVDALLEGRHRDHDEALGFEALRDGLEQSRIIFYDKDRILRHSLTR